MGFALLRVERCWGSLKGQWTAYDWFVSYNFITFRLLRRQQLDLKWIQLSIEMVMDN